MRTRFLNIDYLTTSQSPIETLNFLTLPPLICHLRIFLSSTTIFSTLIRSSTCLSTPRDCRSTPLSPSSCPKQFLSSSMSISEISKILGLQVEMSAPGSLCSFLPTVLELLPLDDFLDLQKEAMVCNEEKEAGSQITFGSKILEKDNVPSADDKDVQRFEVILFEAPELDTFLDNAHFSEKEIETFSAIPEIDNNQDETDPIMQYSKTIQESVYSVEDVTSEINIEQNNYMLEEDNSFGDRVFLQPSIL
ncbi:hypothetical protein CRYUN_Cryun07bG0101500 [Craigia yunnanensis]